MTEEIKKEQPAPKAEEKPAEQKSAEPKPTETPKAEEKKVETPSVPAPQEVKVDMERVSKLEKYRNENMLKEMGFLPQYNSWVQNIMEKEGKSFDDSDINDYLKKEEFSIFKKSGIIDSSNIPPKKEEAAKTEKKKQLTDEEIDKMVIEIPEK